ncbi:universal stress protein [Amycolatopsis sp. NPDC006131]|uniref:universal stress protein n=1 Tax=Amycolatopsis sp. NPDC006131 TaxID=3156731 RepID=UPI0033A17FF9
MSTSVPAVHRHAAVRGPAVHRMILRLLNSALALAPRAPLAAGRLCALRYRSRPAREPVVFPVQYTRAGNRVLVVAGSAAGKSCWRHFRAAVPVGVRLSDGWSAGTGRMLHEAERAAAVAVYRQRWLLVPALLEAPLVAIDLSEWKPVHGRAFTRSWFWIVTLAESAGFAVPAVVGALTAGSAPAVGVDGSGSALDAVRWGARDAARLGVPLRLVHAYPRGERDYSALRLTAEQVRAELRAWGADRRRTAEAVARDTAPGVRVEQRLREGDPRVVLRRESRRAAEVVLGHDGDGGASRLLFGSCGLALAVHGRRPVVVVRGRVTDAGSIVAGVDGSVAAARYAMKMAALYGTSVTALRTWHAPAGDSADRHGAVDLAEASMRRYFASESYRQRPPAPAGSHLVADELGAVAEELRRAFPAADPARVRAIVDDTYRELAAGAKVTDHLITLTLRGARAALEAS